MMRFLRITDYAEESDCKRYTVAAAKVDGIWTFQAWRRSRKGEVAALLTPHRLTIAEDARDACRRHAGQGKARAA